MKWIFLPNSAIHKLCKMNKVLSATTVTSDYNDNKQTKRTITKTRKQKTTEWIPQATREDMNMAAKRISQEGNRISSNSNTKQCQKDQQC